MKIETERRGDVACIRLNDPLTLNAVDTQMIEDIGHALDGLGDARCLILSGSGAAFCSGANLSAAASATPGPPGDLDMGASLESHINPLMTRLRDLPIPWISGVRGAAAGLGCSLALAADIIIASDTAYFLQAFARIGLVPDGGSTFLLNRAVGRPRAMEMMLLGERIKAATALEWGLINRMVADDRLEAEVHALASRLAAGPTRALGMIRQLAWSSADAQWESALASERTVQRDAGRTADFAEGVAAFLEKRPARFTGAEARRSLR